ncbi:Von Willebrand factor type A domain protein [Borrelia nietonii YOR]|uniref:von Willebrand factor type A domain protein n=2 Tax=Borreliaceae TaxID=1643685 RepID=A0ABN4C8T9_9SPIR|nr:Von Willebrand factor type A domain protein [Borrelia nietonii YOR]AHH13670.1 Von Willebrand factor type A domain protein [Borrelia hermsii MTW]
MKNLIEVIMLTFNEPLYLFLLVILPVIIYFSHFFKRRGGKVKFPISIYGNFGSIKLRDYGLNLLYFVTYTFFYLAITVMILTLAGPSISKKKMTYLSSGADIVIVLDISPSMGAIEFSSKNRLEFAKELIKYFAYQRENDNIGLVAFAKEASLIVPLTIDRDFFSRKLDDIYIMDLGNGSALGLGVSIALSHLKHSEAPKRSVIVLTDGVVNSDEVYKDQVINLAQGLNVKIYSIGIGSSEELSVGFKLRSGKFYQGTLREVYDSSMLLEIASKTGGLFYSVNDDFSFKLAIQDFSKKENVERKVKITVDNDDVYNEFLLIIFCLLILYFIFSKVFLKEVL